MNIGTLTTGEPFILPDDVLTHTMAILAKKGAGKSYAAGVIEEEFCKAGLPFVVLDPVGVHWGIRSTADGKRSGFPVVVFGGEHGDVPLARYMGVAVAQAIVDDNISAIIDLTELSKGAWREFVADFCRELYRRNKTPRHVFIEEATEFVPQTRRPELQVAYEAVERLVRMGRNRGLGSTLISQRSAQIAKDVLTQIDILIAMRTVGPQDRKALLDMFEGVLEEDQLPALATFKSKIASLPDGVAWVWSPEYLKAFQTVEIRERETYHAGATPSFEAVRVKQAKPDVTTLRERFAAIPDPKAKPEKPAGKAAGQVAPCNHETELASLRSSVSAAESQVTEAREAVDQAEANAGRYENQAERLERLRLALIATLGSENIPAIDNVLVDEDAIVQRVIARMPQNGAAPAEITPPEALRKKYLEASVDRIIARITSVSDDAKTALEVLLSQDHYWSLNALTIAIDGKNTNRNRWSKALQELLETGLAEKGGSGRSEYRPCIRAGIAGDLAAHSPTDAEIDAVASNVLHRLVGRPTP